MMGYLEDTADNSLLPLRISENGEDDEPLTEVIVCSAISGGKDYSNSMPNEVRLTRHLADGSCFDAIYKKVNEYAMPPQRDQSDE